MDIKEIYKMLHWHSSFGDQLRGIKLAREIDDLSLLVLPCVDGESKSLWDNCARALFELSDDRLEKQLPGLLEWILDLNWPGALIILDRLMIFSGEKLKQPFIDYYNRAVGLNNMDGLLMLDSISVLLDNGELKELLPKDILEVLQKHYNKPGWWCAERF